jgi:hypothetical protein
MTRRARLRMALLLGPAALLAVAVPVGAATAAPPRDKYVGRWNYDQPDPATGRATPSSAL